MRVRNRLFLVLLATSAATALALAFGSIRIVRDAVHDALVARVRAEVDLVADRVAAANPSAYADLLSATRRRLDLRITLIDADGRVVADSNVKPDELGKVENHLGRPEIDGARLSGQGESVRHSATTGDDYFYYARRVDGAASVRYVRGALPDGEMQRFESGHGRKLVFAGLLAVALLSVFTVVAVRRVSRPIEAMTASAERVAAGELHAAVVEPPGEELRRLGHSVNRMRESLLAKLAEIESEQRFLVTMREGMEEGLLLVGDDHRILMHNGAFRRIFRVPVDPNGHRVGQIIRHPGVLGLIDAVATLGEDRRETLSGTPGSDRSFEVHARRVPLPGGQAATGVLVLFFDVTRLEALENVRRQFVADVSHELRTPVTSIKGALETLADGFVQDPAGQRFLEMAQRQADRMAELISDLTDLSLIETGAVRLDLHPVEVASVAELVQTSIDQRFAGRGITIRQTIPRGVFVRADRRRLEQILFNLVDNAVKFNRPGGSVTLAAERLAETVRISVRDTGVGIPSDALERIFQRFYRVDRARSRDVAGTGLGLAIVKHLVHLHEGEITVESTPGAGSCFTVELLAAASPAGGSGEAPEAP